MRIVMTTDDIEIDRRILLEAQSLAEQGHEIIILAPWQEGRLEHEQYGNVKIERFGKQNLAKTSTFFKFSDKITIFLNNCSLFSQEFILKSSIFSQKVCRYVFFKAAEYAQRIVKIIFACMLKCILLVLTTLGKINHLFFKSLSLFFSRIYKFNTQDNYLLNRITYFDPDVIHAHDLPQLKLAVEVKRALNIPLVYDAHELYPEIASLTKKQQTTLSRREKKLTPICDTVITVNPFIAEEMSRRYNIKQPTVILNAAQAPESFSRDISYDLFREEFPISLEDKILLFQGWMSKTRGLQSLTQAMSKVSPDIHLVFMGYGEAIDELKEISKLAKLEHRIHFKNTVSQQDLLFWTSSADVGIIPYQPVDLNNFYCSPNKLFEFIEAGLPILANDLPFLRKIICEENFGMVSELTDSDSYAVAINTIFSKIKQKSDLFKEDIKAKAAQYCWKNEEKKLFEVYSALQFVNK